MDVAQSIVSGPLFVRKRDGVTEQPFDIVKIVNAIRAASDEVMADVSEDEIINIAMYVGKQLSGEIADVEKIQDLVEFALVKFDKIDIAKHYTTYRRKREKLRHRRLEADPAAIADYIVPSKYARYLPEKKRRETYPEAVDRVRGMHLRRFAGRGLDETINWAFDKVQNKEVLPSMRSMQFGGQAIESKHARIYNCCSTLIDRPEAFSHALWLLLCGAGVGFNICIEHVEKLPALKYIDEDAVVYHTIEDTIEGWADALKILIDSYVNGYNVEFNYTQIRLKGTPLKTSGGKAPGHRELKKALREIRKVLHAAQGRKLRPIECLDMMCLAADAVLSGGVRRSSLIAIFSLEDSEMMYAKTGNWYKTFPWRQNANISVGLVKGQVRKDQFIRIFDKTKQFGEPGFTFLTHIYQCYNPCVEISLDPRLLITQEIVDELAAKGINHRYKIGEYASGFAFCNLTTINAALFKTVDDFLEAAKAAAVIGTLQASYTDFEYLGWVSEYIAKRDALLGVSMTGIMDCAEIAAKPEYQQAACKVAIDTNREIAAAIGINPAARVTTVKPEGTSSLVLGSVGSGHHAHHARRYIRRVTANPLEPVFQYFKKHNPHMCVEKKKGGDWVIEFVVEAPPNAIVKDDVSAIQFLELVKSTQINWVNPGTARPEVSPGLRHNVSNTVHVKDYEWYDVGEYLWDNQDNFAAVSLLSFTGDKVYDFSPFEAIVSETDEHRWNNIIENYVPVDYTQMIEEEDGTALSKEQACAGGACLI